MSLLHSLAAASEAVVADGPLEWRVIRLTPAAALKAGAGLPGWQRVQQMATGQAETPPDGEPSAADAARAEMARALSQTLEDPSVKADAVAYTERIVMQAVAGVRRAGSGGPWEDVTLVPPKSQDPDKGRLAVTILSPATMGAIRDAALKSAREAAESVGAFPGEE